VPLTYEQKIAAILALEDQRRLREPSSTVAPSAIPPPLGPRERFAPLPPQPPPPPDLVRFLGDDEARVRRRAALAIGRVGLQEGVAALVARLSDPEAEVRQMVCFALGLLGDVSARDPLVARLDDDQPIVKGSAAEALGLIGDEGAAEAIARMVTQIIDSGALSTLPGDEADTVRDTPAAAVRLGLFALARLKAFEALAAAALDAGGQPRQRWWPVAYALHRVEDARAVPALLSLLGDSHPYTRAFAARGLGALKEAAAPAVPVLLPLVTGSDRLVAIEAIRALGRLGDARAAPALLAMARAPKADPTLRRESIIAAGGVSGEAITELLIDTLGDPSPSIRGAVLSSLARREPETFIALLSGLDPDPEWRVRAALADALGALPSRAGLPRLRAMLRDPDARVLPAVLASLVTIQAPDAAASAVAALGAEDPVARAAAARALGALKDGRHAGALVEAYQRGQGDPTFVARLAALAALNELGTPEAASTLTQALADRDWVIRVRAADWLRAKGVVPDALERIRPAPPSRDGLDYAATHLVAPAVSTQAFIDTERGTIQLELAVLDAPLTADTFVTLARRGFYDGQRIHRVVPNYFVQAGDPRGDSAGGPGFTIRDEINQRPHIRGTVAMAIDGPETGGSQFFITHSPHPQLDARDTVFGRVLSGMDIVDRLQVGDLIERVRIWDGVEQ